jgi:hypothetical protein
LRFWALRWRPERSPRVTAHLTVATARAEEVGSATAVVAMEDTVGVATVVMVAEATAVTVMAGTAEVTADMAMEADMGTASTLATEAMAVTAIAADTGMDTAGEDTMAVVITGMGTAIGAVADITAAHTGAVQYSALDSATSRQGRFATTRMGIRYRVTCIHRMCIEVAGR